MDLPRTLQRSISPPPVQTRRTANAQPVTEVPLPLVLIQDGESNISGLAAVEAGKAIVSDHLQYFCHHLSQVVKPLISPEIPRISILDYAELYRNSCHPHGHHFVIHQHNHPIAGLHYDLRLQFSESSSCSFAIPYGLPGNPDSKRQGRMAIETRVHTLWNNLIESASHATGSLLIWDTGKYEVLPRNMAAKRTVDTDDEQPDDEDSSVYDSRHENEKLIEAFKTRYIRLRLRGTKLPAGYTITIRLPSQNNVVKHSQPMRRKRKPSKADADQADTDSDEHDTDTVANNEVGHASDDDDNESTTIRATNAYIGAVNSIGSIHQRHWLIALDRGNSGFVKKGENWVRADADRGFEPFYVRGAAVETSVVTGRTSAEVMADEGVEGFVARKRWRPILE